MVTKDAGEILLNKLKASTELSIEEYLTIQ